MSMGAPSMLYDSASKSNSTSCESVSRARMKPNWVLEVMVMGVSEVGDSGMDSL